MFDKFADYLFYLLPGPYKLVKKQVNQWYILFRVLGAALDEAQGDLERALDETMVATCSVDLLPYFAEEKGLYRYKDEDDESFRSRIAMHDDYINNGGMRDSLIAAAMALGYKDVAHIWCRDEDMSEDRWAEFVIQCMLHGAEEHPARYELLRKEIGKYKESTSYDNYRYVNVSESPVYVGILCSSVNRIRIGDDG